MESDAGKQFLDHLAQVYRHSLTLSWEQILHEGLQAFAQSLGAPQADLVLFDEQQHPLAWASTDAAGPLPASQALLSQPDRWLPHIRENGFAPYTEHEAALPLRLLTIPNATELPVAAIALVNLETPPAPDLLEEGPTFAIPLFQTVRLLCQQEKDQPLKKQLQVLHHLYEISTGLLTQVSTHEVVFILLRTLSDLLPAALDTAFYSQENGKWQRIKTYTNKPAQSLKLLLPEEPQGHEVQLMEACFHERTLIIGSEPQKGPAPYFWQNTATTGICQRLYFPLCPPMSKFGGVITVTLEQDMQLSQQELALAGALIQQGTAALARVHLYENSLQEQSQLRAILESSKDGIFLIGQNLQIDYVNGQALQLLALSGDPTMWEGRSFPEAIAVIREESRELARILLRSARKISTPGGPLSEEIAELTLKMRRQLSLTLLQWPVYSHRGELLGGLFMMRDVTEQKALERMRDDFLHMLVHDMRNPLSIIISTLDMLKDPTLQSTSQEIIPLALGKAEGMLNLVVAILDISRLESGHVRINKTPVSLASIVKPLNRYLAFSAKNIRMEIDLPPDLPDILVDRSFVERIFQNLTDNATKFSPIENGLIRISAVQEGDWIKAEVYNNGVPISPEIEAHLFEKFVTDKYPGQGYGLGLSFCQLAVEVHGGKIWAQNHSKGGVSFFLTLPTVSANVPKIGRASCRERV